MKQRKPLTKEEEIAICTKCSGWCCNNYFHSIDAKNGDATVEFHKFRQRDVITYGGVPSIIMKDKCPWSNEEKRICDKYGDPCYPKVCSEFPDRYRPFWNLRCKLMRVRYARGLIPKDIVSFSKLHRAIKPKETFFKHFK